MSTELLATGTIVKASKSGCVVSVIVGTSTTQLSFRNTKFYSYGLKCDGDMTNLLEDGMEVELCIQILPDTTPEVLIAWLGDRPDVVDDEVTLKPVYAQRGVFTGVWLCDFVIESNCGKVVVNRAIVFRDGEKFATLTTEDEVWFDAVPLEGSHATGAAYKATCAWVGCKPRLVDRFKLGGYVVADQEVVTGTVVVVPNEVVAVVDVELEIESVNVLVFRSSFKDECDRIQDVVEVGDKLHMGLWQGFVFPKKNLWLAQVAMKGVGDLPSKPVDGGGNGAANRDIPTVGDEASSVKSSVKEGREALYRIPPLIGVISRMPGSGYVITYRDSKVYLDGGNYYEGGKRGSYSDLKSYATSGKNTVKFEAVALNLEDAKYAGCSHEATCAWRGKKPTLGAVAAHLPVPNMKLLQEKNQFFYGIVSKICFPLIALVKIPGLTTAVSVHASDFITKGKRTDSGKLISEFVKLGDCVQFKVRRRPDCWDFLCAHEVEHAKYSKELYDNVNSGRVSRKPSENVVKH